jgi:hypothetical protein
MPPLIGGFGGGGFGGGYGGGSGAGAPAPASPFLAPAKPAATMGAPDAGRLDQRQAFEAAATVYAQAGLPHMAAVARQRALDLSNLHGVGPGSGQRFIPVAMPGSEWTPSPRLRSEAPQSNPWQGCTGAGGCITSAR